MVAVEELAAVGVEGQGVAVAVALIIDSILTPACPICSRALSKNTWTLCMRGPLKWQVPDMGLDQGMDTGMDLIPTPTHISTHTGSHQPT